MRYFPASGRVPETNIVQKVYKIQSTFRQLHWRCFVNYLPTILFYFPTMLFGPFGKLSGSGDTALGCNCCSCCMGGENCIPPLDGATPRPRPRCCGKKPPRLPRPPRLLNGMFVLRGPERGCCCVKSKEAGRFSGFEAGMSLGSSFIIIF